MSDLYNLQERLKRAKSGGTAEAAQRQRDMENTQPEDRFDLRARLARAKSAGTARQDAAPTSAYDTARHDQEAGILRTQQIKEQQREQAHRTVQHDQEAGYLRTLGLKQDQAEEAYRAALAEFNRASFAGENPDPAELDRLEEAYRRAAGQGRGNKTDVGKLALGMLVKGTNQAGYGIAAAADFANRKAHELLLGWTPEEYDSSDTLTREMLRRVERERSASEEYFAPNANSSRAAQIADEIGTGVVAAVPQALLAIMSAGASAGATATTATLEQTAASSSMTGAAALANTAKTAVAEMAKDPLYWSSFTDVVGVGYEDAKANGADDKAASYYAVINGLLNAMVEVGGGGIQEIPEKVRSGGGPALMDWIESAFDEGKEEVIQGVIERGLQNMVYGAENPLYSVTDETAIFNPVTSTKEFGLGAAVGGILGGGEMLAQGAMNAAAGAITGSDANSRSRAENQARRGAEAQEAQDTAEAVEASQAQAQAASEAVVDEMLRQEAEKRAEQEAKAKGETERVDEDDFSDIDVEAVRAALEEAERNGGSSPFVDRVIADAERLAQQEAPEYNAPERDLRKPEAWDSIINQKRVDSLTESERKAVLDVFEKPVQQPQVSPSEILREKLRRQDRWRVNDLDFWVQYHPAISSYTGLISRTLDERRNTKKTLYSTGTSADEEKIIDELVSFAETKRLLEPTDSKPVQQPKVAPPEKKSGQNTDKTRTGADKPHEVLARGLREILDSGKKIIPADLKRLADAAYGGTRAEGAYDIKTAYDALELAVNQYIMNDSAVKNGSAAEAVETVRHLEELLAKIPTQTVRTEEQQTFQQFSTPPNIAYLAAWAGNVSAGDVVLEPSAGIGGLAVFPKAWGATVYGNELSERRADILRSLGLDEVFTENAEQINNVLPDRVKPTVVLMNPPFSSTAGRTATNRTANAKRHVEQALERLEDGGRLVAVLGRGMSNDSKTFASWWNELRQDYDIRANLSINGQNYRKYGTTFDVQMVVIDKTGPQMGRTVTAEVTDLTKVPGLLEGIRNDRTRLDTGDSEAVERVRDGQLEPLPDSGVQADRGKRPDIGGRDNGSNDGRAVSESSVQRSGKRNGTGGNRSGVSEVSRSGGENALQRGRNSGGSGRADRAGAGKLQLERGNNVLKKAKAASENPDSVYSAYAPQKVRIKGAKPHPAKLVESSAMAAVDPPDVTYTPNLPENIVRDGVLSDAQLENVVYAGQAHEKKLADGRRKGFFIGDGTGVGKGRQISGIIMDNFRNGRDRAIWISEKAPLINDARRDWTALGGSAEDIYPLGEKTNPKKVQSVDVKSGIIFGTYDTLKSDVDKRIKLLKDWLGEDFDGVIAFDEAHNMGNAMGQIGARGRTKPSAKATAGIALQNAFPNARVLYASATGATEASNYAYLERLGLWGKGTAFNDFNDFMSKISNGGLAAMELVARDMKAMGSYMARSISYDDVKYDTLQHNLTPMQTEIYDTMSKAWQKVFQNFNRALEVTGQNKNGQARGRAMSAIYGTQQRFYDQIITSMSMPSVIEDIRKELANGRSVVIQLTKTNAAAADRAIAKNAEAGGELDDLDLTPSDSLIQMVMNSFPMELYEEYTDDKGNIQSRPVMDSKGQPVLDKKAVKMRDALVDDLKMMRVPDGPLEMLFDAFGEDQVAEVTGRTRRVVEKLMEDGSRKRVVESRSQNSGIADANAFQDGKKRILVFSDAGGTGRSYHADLTAKNQQQRVHYLLQPGWNASKAVQGFGRTHRSNQASAPIFRLVTTNVMGQKRFTSTIARRLDQLGALTKGQRQAGSGVFSEKDNLENPIAMDALSRYYRTVDAETLKKLGLYDKLYDSTGKFNEKSEAARDIGKFLNRILALEVEEQNRVFEGFYEMFDSFMDAAIQNGTVDMGLENFRADKVEVIDEKTVRKDETGADTRYVQMKVSRKTLLTPYGKVKDVHPNFQGLVRTEHGAVRAVYEISSKTNPNTGEIQRRFKLESPVRGKFSTYMEDTMKRLTTDIPKAEWKTAWAEETEKAPEYEESTLHLLTGTLLPIWNRLPQNNTRVIRVLASDGTQYLGRAIPPDQIDGILQGLGANRTMKTYTGAEIVDAVLNQGKEAVFRDDRLRLARRRVGGDWRLELTGANVWYLQRQYPGVFMERINYENRYFLPSGQTGENILEQIIVQNPVMDLQQRGEVEYSRESGADHSDQWTAQRVGDTKKKPKSLSEIVEQIRHDFDINITTGHIRGAGIRGQYDAQVQGIRSKINNDLPTISHELGHHFDNVYDIVGSITQDLRNELTANLGEDFHAEKYTKKKLAGEGVAEYLRKYLQNRETAVIDYPLFSQYFMEALTGKDRALIQQLADEVNAYYSLDAGTATSSIRFREERPPDARTAGERAEDRRNKFRMQWIDRLDPIKRLDRESGGNAYILATNSAYSDAIIGRILEAELTDPNGQYVGPGLKTALHGIKLRNNTEYREFGEYLVVRHGPERLKEGMRVFADDRKNSTAWMNRRQAELEAKYPEFQAAADRLYAFQRQFLETWGVGTGLVDRNTAKQWAERWKYYVPFNRAVGMERRGAGARRGFANQNSTIRRAYGSGLDIIDPVDNIIVNMVKMVNAGVRNNVMREIVGVSDEIRALYMEKVPVPLKQKTFDMTGVKKTLEKAGDEALLHGMFDENTMDTYEQIVASLDDILTQYGKGKARGDVVTVLRNGKQEFWKINDPDLLEALTTMNPVQANGIMKVISASTRFMTANITGNNPVWSIFSNAPRDLVTLFTYSGAKNPAKLLSGIASTYINAFNARFRKGKGLDPLYAEYLAMGGGHTSAYSADMDLTRRVRKKISGDAKDRVLDVVNPVHWVSFLTDTIEQGPRFATYRYCRNSGMNPQEAFHSAMDVTVNFRRAGTLSRSVGQFVPFFNAGVQGLDKFGRYFSAEDVKGKGRAKAAAGRFLAFFAASAIIAALEYGLNNGDDEKKREYQLLSNYTKNSYLVIPLGDGKYFAIPKARELAVLESLFVTALEYTEGGNKHAFEEFWDYATDAFLPGLLSDIAQIPSNIIQEGSAEGTISTIAGILGNFGVLGTGVYMATNRDFLGKPIVSTVQKGMEAKDAWNSNTSKMAYWIGQGLNWYPVMVDYFGNQVLGYLWKIPRALLPMDGGPDWTLGVRNSYIKDDLYSTDLVNWLYNKADASSRAHASDKADIDKAITARMDDNMTTFYSRFNSLNKKNTGNSQRANRDKVLEMFREYQKADDANALTKEQEAVYGVVREMDETELLPSVMQNYVKNNDGERRDLTDAQYYEYQTEYLGLYYEYAVQAIENGKTQREKVAGLRAAKEAAKERATANVLKRIGLGTSDWARKYAGVRDRDVVTFKAGLDLADDDDGKVYQEEVIAILEEMERAGVDGDDLATLFRSYKNYSDKNNPWA